MSNTSDDDSTRILIDGRGYVSVTRAAQLAGVTCQAIYFAVTHGKLPEKALRRGSYVEHLIELEGLRAYARRQLKRRPNEPLPELFEDDETAGRETAGVSG